MNGCDGKTTSFPNVRSKRCDRGVDASEQCEQASRAKERRETLEEGAFLTGARLSSPPHTGRHTNIAQQQPHNTTHKQNKSDKQTAKKGRIHSGVGLSPCTRRGVKRQGVQKHLHRRVHTRQPLPTTHACKHTYIKVMERERGRVRDTTRVQATIALKKRVKTRHCHNSSTVSPKARLNSHTHTHNVQTPAILHNSITQHL